MSIVIVKGVIDERACERINVAEHRLDAAERGRTMSELASESMSPSIGSTPRSGVER